MDTITKIFSSVALLAVIGHGLLNAEPDAKPRHLIDEATRQCATDGGIVHVEHEGVFCFLDGVDYRL